MFNGARIVGPAIAGILVAAVGEGWCFFGNSVSYIAVLMSLFAMKLTPTVRRALKSPFTEIREGFTYVATTPPVRALLLMLGLVSLAGTPYAVLMPVFANDILGGDSGTLGFLMGCSGIGALAAALTLASRRHVFGLGKWVAAACAGLGASLIAFSFSRSVPLSALILVPVGFSMMTQMSSSNTLVQAMIPDELRGRVMSVYSMMFMGLAPVGSLMAGTIAGYLGPAETVAIGGTICLIGGLVFATRLSKLGEQGREMIVAMQMTAGEPASKAIAQVPK
jgi:MFS family permease